MSIRYEDVLFAYDFDTTLVQGGVTYLKDWGPNKCHLSLGAATAPTRTTAIDGVSYTFNGTTQFLSMDAPAAARFWSALVDGHTDYTFICKAYFRAPAASDCIFDAQNAVPTAGLVLRNRTAFGSTDRLNVECVAAAGQARYGDASDVPLTGRTRVVVLGGRFNAAAVPTPYYRLYDGGLQTTFYSTVIGVPLPFDRTVLPTIGCRSTLANYFDGRLYYLALAKALPTPREVEKYSAALMDGTYKPWCVR